MELVYLWVDSYKNIRNQGFNFSPRFECEFDGENLTITENEDYVSIFPKNINITAIVGENGSGKSNLLKNIEKISKLKLYYKDYITILKKGKELFYFSSNEIKLNKTCIKLTNLNLDEELKQREIQRVFIKNDEINEQTFNEEYFNLLIQNQKIDYQFLNKNFFDSCRIKISKRKKEDFLSLNNISGNSDLFSSYETTLEIRKKENIFYCFEFILNEIIFTFGRYKENIKKDINAIKETKEIIKETKEIIKKYKNEIDKSNPYYYQNKNYQKLFKLFFKFNISKFDNIYEDLTKTYSTKYIKKLNELIKYNELLSYLKEEYVLIYDFFDSSTNVYFEDLSDGEKRFLGFFTHLANKIKHEYHDNNFILLDEPDIFLHPNWQKKFIKNLIDFFKINYPDKILRIFITSHSPFILSDIPKENVIFLDKYKENDEEVKKDIQKIGNCKNVTKDIDIKTFGANIHTLLSNGFFMKDGLMGEFAKSKINEVYNFITQKDTNFIKTKKEAQNIINLIGEPLIKKQLQKLFDETFDKNNLTLDDEIELLEKKLNALKELKNDKN